MYEQAQKTQLTGLYVMWSLGKRDELILWHHSAPREQLGKVFVPFFRNPVTGHYLLNLSQKECVFIHRSHDWPTTPHLDELVLSGLQ